MRTRNTSTPCGVRQLSGSGARASEEAMIGLSLMHAPFRERDRRDAKGEQWNRKGYMCSFREDRTTIRSSVGSAAMEIGDEEFSVVACRGGARDHIQGRGSKLCDRRDHDCQRSTGSAEQ